MKVKREDGVHYNRKRHRWEIWKNGELIYLRNIFEESIIHEYNKTVEIAINMYGFYDYKFEKVEYEPIDTGKISRKEFGGNVLVTVSEHEVRLWVCNEQGANIFRFKALGKVYQGGNDIAVVASL